jgi:cold shock CspA family protein
MFKLGVRHQDRDRLKDEAMAKFEKKTNKIQDLIGKRVRGQVITFTKSFGFITIGHGSPDIFFHFNDVTRARVLPSGYKLFRSGDRVEFTIQENQRKPGSLKAIDVSLLDSENAVAV